MKFKTPTIKDLASMPAAKARIMIARDVIKALKTKHFIAQHGSYVVSTELSQLLGNRSPHSQVRDLFLDKAPECNVCALGGLFVAVVERSDNITPNDLSISSSVSCVNEDSLRRTLATIFPAEMLAEIEAAFESWSVRSTIRNAYDYSWHATGVDLDYSKADIRMAMVMKNIIRNHGTFMPELFIKRLKDHGYDEKL